MGAARGAVRRRRSWHVFLTPSFLRDAQAQIEWLRADDRSSSIKALRTDLRVARRLLGRTPFLAPEDERGIRRLLLGNVAYFLWYRADEASRTVRWVRLFHARQQRARG